MFDNLHILITLHSDPRYCGPLFVFDPQSTRYLFLNIGPINSIANWRPCPLSQTLVWAQLNVDNESPSHLDVVARFFIIITWQQIE